MREQRKKDLEDHVETVNQLLRRANGEETEDEAEEDDSDSKEEEQIAKAAMEPGREEEYVDEDRYTTVTVEPMRLSENEDESEGSEDEDDAKKREEAAKQNEEVTKKKRIWTKKKPDDSRGKKKKKKFKYESPVERKMARTKAKTRNSAAAKARRGD